MISINERFVINEKFVNKVLLKKTIRAVKAKIKQFELKNKHLGKLTEFETLTVIAFVLFAKQKVDIAFLEVGLGGRLDATNVINTKNLICSVITNISYDHMQHLGSTLEKIAYEKAGIIKENNNIITGTEGRALSVIKQIATNLKANLKTVSFSKSSSILNYRNKNITIALKAWDIISSQIKTQRNNKIENKNFLSKLQFPGRLQLIQNHKMLLDGAHNPAAACELRQFIHQEYKNKKIVYIFGMLDKDYKQFIDNLFPKQSTVFCTKPKSFRATEPFLLSKYLIKKRCNATCYANLKSALYKAKDIPHDLIIITGSLYLIGESLKILGFVQK